MGNGRAVAGQQEGGKSARAFQLFNLNHKPKLDTSPNMGRVAEGFIKMEHKIDIQIKCKSCASTGLYVGMAERNGVAIVCNTCKGTGCHNFKYEYEDFEERTDRNDVKRVHQVNVGIIINDESKYGGLPYKDWKNGVKFFPGTENRSCTCPAWWYQSADYKRKPNWKRCDASWGSSFSQCKFFPNKNECWNKWDKEFDN